MNCTYVHHLTRHPPLQQFTLLKLLNHVQYSDVHYLECQLIEMTSAARVILSGLQMLKGHLRGGGIQHVCQIGNPVLRKVANPVPRDKISTAEFQQLLDHMIRIMRETRGVGLAAPQVGVSLQVFCMELTELHLKLLGPEKAADLQMTKLPLTILINPHLTITNHATIVREEGCLSVGGYVGRVARATAVQVKGINRHGNDEQHDLIGWSARIVQHEVDHLQGVIYVDKMAAGSLRSMVCEEHRGLDEQFINSLRQQNIL